MNFGFSEEQEELRKMVKRFLEEKSPESEVRRLMATSEGYDSAVWDQMAKELALQGLGIPEEFGGQGYGPVELYVVFEEMGAALFCSPYFSSVALAANAVLFVGNDADKAAYLPGIASGETIATVALTDDAGLWDLTTTSTTASASGDAFVVNGVPQLRHRRQHGVSHLRASHERQGPLALRRGGRREGRGARIARHDGPDRKQSRVVFSDAPARLVAWKAKPSLASRRRCRWPPLRWPPNRSVAPNGSSTTPWSTRRTACSSAARLDRSRRSSTSVRTCS